ncbi:MAG: hypothetical protein AAGB00_02960 [Planctomycetota bacterium]
MRCRARRRTSTSFLAAFLAALIAGGTGVFAAAADLRIETRVYETAEETLVNESVTCFQAGAVYDFRPAAKRVTIFRAAVGDSPSRFLLLDTEREQFTEIAASQITATMTKLRRWAAAQDDPFLRFTGAPRFEESFDAESGELRMASDQLTYRIITEPLKHPEVNLELRAFLDGFAQLHTLVEAGLPPEPRLRVNEALFRHRVIPLQVELTARDDEEPSLRAEHVVDWVLSKQDRMKIDRSADQLASFQKVSNAEFHKGRRQLASVADRGAHK